MNKQAGKSISGSIILFSLFGRHFFSIVIALLLLTYAAVASAQHPGSSRPKIALVLSGGGALGLAHIGVLEELEKQRIPVDCVVGTSMGALVGGVYAAGINPAAMHKAVNATDIIALFNDKPERTQIEQQIKRNDYQPLFDFSLGFNKRKVELPPGVSSGYRFELFLKRLIGTGASVSDLDFDELPLPYRAVATDLETGELKVFRQGDLSRVMRASMSLPAIVAPTEIDGHIYVDGGLVRNLPVDIGRHLCGDIIIAVNLGTPPMKREQIRNTIDVARQSIIILTEQNVRISLASLRESDILISPNLKGFESSSFSGANEIIARGTAAARASRERLSHLALTQDNYAAWLASRQERRPENHEINAIKTETTGFVNPQALKLDIDTRPGTEFEIEQLHQDITEIYGRGDFSYAGYSVIREKNNTSIVVRAESKPWGPGYLRFGIGAATDFHTPTKLNLAATYQRTWINDLGAEWRTDLQLGDNAFLRTEFIQPMQVRDGAFVSPYAVIGREQLQFFNRQQRLGEYIVNRASTGVDIGLTSPLGELRIGPYYSRIKTAPDFGAITAYIPNHTINQKGLLLRGVYDQLDSLSFPTTGFYAAMEVKGALENWGSDDDFTRAGIALTGVESFGKHTLSAHLEWGDELTGLDHLPVYEAFKLGGPGRLSGLYLDQLTGFEYNLVTLTYYRKYASLPPQLGRGLYFGATAEAGRIDDQYSGDPWDWITAGSIFWGADTILGPAYIGYGFSSADQQNWYLMIGPRF